MFPEKGSACDEAIAKLILSLIPMIPLIVVLGEAIIAWLAFTGELSLILLKLVQG